MSKKDYELIADVLRDQRNLAIIFRQDPTPTMIAHAFADRLAIANPRFDRAMFLRAVGV